MLAVDLPGHGASAKGGVCLEVPHLNYSIPYHALTVKLFSAALGSTIPVVGTASVATSPWSYPGGCHALACSYARHPLGLRKYSGGTGVDRIHEVSHPEQDGPPL